MVDVLYQRELLRNLVAQVSMPACDFRVFFLTLSIETNEDRNKKKSHVRIGPE